MDPISPSYLPTPASTHPGYSGASHASSSSSSSSACRSEWLDSIVRELVRLYVYSTLPLRKIVEELGGHHGTASAHNKLFLMIGPDLGWLRPNTELDMNNRIASLRARTEYGRRLKLRSNARASSELDMESVEADASSLISQPKMDATKSTNTSHENDQSPGSNSSDQSLFRDRIRPHDQPDEENIKMIMDDDFAKFCDSISTTDNFAPVVPEGERWRAISENGIILPSDFLHVDRHRSNPDSCLEGTQTHRLGDCFCAVSKGDYDGYWALPDGIPPQAQHLLQKDADFAKEDKQYDVLGNTILHFLAARAQPVVLFSALAVFGAVTDLNTGGQTFMHCLGPQWFNLGSLEPLRLLLKYLKSIDFDLNGRDIYGQSIFHILARRIPGSAAMKDTMACYYTKGYFLKRDAFGYLPSMTLEPALGLRGQSAWGHEDDRTSSLQSGPNDSLIPIDIECDRNVSNSSNQPTDCLFIDHGQLLAIINKASADPKIEDSNGGNALHCLAAVALSTGSVEATREVPRHTRSTPGRNRRTNADPRRESQLRLEILEGLLLTGVDVNAYNASGNNVLMEFVIHLPDCNAYPKIPVILTKLINHGASLNARNRQGDTALHLAVRHGHKLAMRTLVQHGAVVHARNRDGQSPLQLLAELIRKASDDIRTYSNLEACYAWLSRDTVGAVLKPSFTDEWSTPEMSIVDRALPVNTPACKALIESELFRLGLCEEPNEVRIKHEQMDTPESSQCTDNNNNNKRGTPSDVSTWSSIKTPPKPEPSESAASTSTRFRDRHTLVDDMCDSILSNAFSVTIEEIPNPVDVWQSVQTCLSEISAIVGFDCEMTQLRDNQKSPVSLSGDSLSSDNSGNKSTQMTTSKPSSKSLGKRKAWDSGDGDDGSEERNSDGRNNPGSNSSPPERKKVKECVRFSCPYRKRNPLRFHVRDHLNCATQSFSSMTLLKRHVTTFHKRKALPTYTCTRCQMSFTTEQDRDGHLRVPLDQICAIQDKSEGFSSQEDPENGITPDIDDVLRDRRGRVQVLNWGVLWRTLFPGDDTVPPAGL
ncbi:hypothetical protein EDB80DRAFT_435053 [Ilyonectria destructans]|nr:hypothetical protein EDB80DRAFT_435053 [Ilyonectria destructans]